MPKKVPSGKKRKLTDQPSVLQAVIRYAITQATDDVILRNNWPEDNNRNLYGKELVLKGCHDAEIVCTYDMVGEVKRRVKTDPGFTKGLCDLVSSILDLDFNLMADFIWRSSTASPLSAVRPRLKPQNVYLLINLGLGKHASSVLYLL